MNYRAVRAKPVWRTTGMATLWLMPLLALGQDDLPPACADEPVFSALDFWVGHWDVISGGETVGQNRIEKTLNDCAILEHWTSAGGGQGKSLFYVIEGDWKQFWVTERALLPGGAKEKSRVDDIGPPAVRFQGEVRHPEAGTWLDRTTLTPLDGETLRQIIEISRDGGRSWETTFDGIYRRKPAR